MKKWVNKGLQAGVVAVVATVVMVSSAYGIDVQPEQPPNTNGVLKVLGWVLWLVTAGLFGWFIMGLYQAGKARRAGGSDVEAPLWPLVAGGIAASASTIWTALVGI